MTWDWEQITLWFFTSFIGAGIIKLLDLAVDRYKQRQSKTESKVEKVINHINNFGELTELYRFFAYVSNSIVKDEKGNLLKDNNGNFITEIMVLEPEPQYKYALEAMKEADISSAIAQKIATIRLQSAEALDTALELDPSGDLNKQISELFIKSVINTSNVLKNKGLYSPNDNFRYLTNALKESDDCRRKVRNELRKYTE